MGHFQRKVAHFFFARIILNPRWYGTFGWSATSQPNVPCDGMEVKMEDDEVGLGYSALVDALDDDDDTADMVWSMMGGF